MTEDRLVDYDAGSPTHVRLDVLAHKWTLQIVLALMPGPQRFTQLRSVLPGVSSQVLADSVRELERDGIVVRRHLDDASLHAAYSVTALGRTLCEPARAIRHWAEKHGDTIVVARERYDRTTGRQIR